MLGKTLSMSGVVPLLSSRRSSSSPPRQRRAPRVCLLLTHCSHPWHGEYSRIALIETVPQKAQTDRESRETAIGPTKSGPTKHIALPIHSSHDLQAQDTYTNRRNSAGKGSHPPRCHTVSNPTYHACNAVAGYANDSGDDDGHIAISVKADRPRWVRVAVDANVCSIMFCCIAGTDFFPFACQSVTLPRSLLLIRRQFEPICFIHAHDSLELTDG